MIDRTDLQLMLIEQICEMDTAALMALFQEITGSEMAFYDEDSEVVIGQIEAIDIADPAHLKKMLGFFLYALGERCTPSEAVDQ